MVSVDQSSITGESLAVDKFTGEIAYYTCGVKRGKCYAVVSSSAKQSFVGRTASLVLGAFGAFLSVPPLAPLLRWECDDKSKHRANMLPSNLG